MALIQNIQSPSSSSPIWYQNHDRQALLRSESPTRGVGHFRSGRSSSFAGLMITMWWSHEDERWLLFFILYRTMMTKSLWNISKQATFYPREWARLSYRLTMIKGNFLYWVFLFNQIWKDQEQALLVIISQTLLSWVLLLMITKDDIQIKIITQSSATAVCVKSIFWQNLFLGAAQ